MLKQYQAFFKVLAPASKAVPAERGRLLAPYTEGPELDHLISAMAQNSRNGRVYYGTIGLRPRVQVLRPERHLAVISDCQDAMRFGLADVKTGRKLSRGVARTATSVSMNLGKDGVWRVSYVSYPGGKC